MPREAVAEFPKFPSDLIVLAEFCAGSETAGSGAAGRERIVNFGHPENNQDDDEEERHEAEENDAVAAALMREVHFFARGRGIRNAVILAILVPPPDGMDLGLGRRGR
jgi:hypothetical protein